MCGRVCSGREVFGDGVEAGEDVARPVGVAELVDGEEMDVAVEARGLAEKGLAFFVGADAEDGGARHRGGKVTRDEKALASHPSALHTDWGTR